MKQEDPKAPFSAAPGYAACWQCPLWRPNENDTGWCRLTRIDFPAESPACEVMRYSIEVGVILTERAHMYEFVRTLNAHEFAELYKANISGKGRFDDLILAAMSERAKRHNAELTDGAKTGGSDV